VAQLGSAGSLAATAKCTRPSRGFLQGRQTCQDLVVRFAQGHGVLDLEPDRDSRLLVEALAAERGGSCSTVSRTRPTDGTPNASLALHFNDPLDRFLFRGA